MNRMILLSKIIQPLLLFVSLITSLQLAHADDQYLQGYLSAILEQQLGWQPGSYQIKVENAVATISIAVKNNSQIATATQAFSKVPTLVDFNFIQQTDTRLSPPSYIHYPRGDYFKPDVADVKEPQFFISFLRADTGVENILLGSVGIGQNFGLYRWPASVSSDGWQLNFFASLLSQFNLDASSDDLLNSDYLVGFPVSFRFGNFTGRFRFFHQSSHLGDELLLSGNAPERINLSIEAVDLELAYDIGYWRGMIGGMKIVSHDPSDLEERAVMTGIDYRNPAPIFGNSRFIAGIKTTWLEDAAWDNGTSLKFGLEIGQTYPVRHGTRIMFEAYKGLIPFGQFYTLDIEYYGMGVYLDF